VYIAPSLDGCVAQLSNYNVEPSHPDINEEIRITGTHLNSFQDWSYDSISACEAENAQLTEGEIFNTEYTLIIKKDGSVYDTKTGTLPNNDDYNTPKSFEITWTPIDYTEYGEYTAVLDIESTGNTENCEPGTTTTQASSTFEIGYDNDDSLIQSVTLFASIYGG
jgi:hypothetical protein